MTLIDWVAPANHMAIQLPSGFSLRECEDFVSLCQGERQVALFSASISLDALCAQIDECLCQIDPGLRAHRVQEQQPSISHVTVPAGARITQAVEILAQVVTGAARKLVPLLSRGGEAPLSIDGGSEFRDMIGRGKQEGMLEHSVERVPDAEAVVLHIRGEIDQMTSQTFDERVSSLSCDGHHLIIDLSQIAHIDASGLRILSLASASCGERGRLLLLAAPPPYLRELLGIVQLDRPLTILGSVNEAIDHARGRN
jgi:anti-anti-sigma factor